MGRTEPVERGIQSIWFLKMAICGTQGKEFNCQWSLACKLMLLIGHAWRPPYQIAVLLGAHPDVTVAPFAELAKLPYFWVIMLLIVLYREARRIVYTYVAAQKEEDARSFVGEEFRVGPAHWPL